MGAPVATYTGKAVVPLYGEGIERHVNFLPNITISAGQILGQVSSANTSEVQTINFSGSWTAADTFTLSIVGIDGGTYSTTLTLSGSNTVTNSVLKTAIDALLDAAGYLGATVTIGSGPAPTDTTVTFGGTAANFDIPLMTVTYVVAGNGTVTVDATTAGVRTGLYGAYSGAKLANPTAAPTAASLTGGTGLPLLMQGVISYTYKNSVGETLPSPGAAFALTTTDRSIRVSSISLPTGATGVNYYINGVYAGTSDGSQTDITALATTASKPLPTMNTAFTTTDGRQVAKAIAKYDFRTDYMGRVVYSTGSPQDAYHASAPVWFEGDFATADLVGLDANAVNDFGRLKTGTIANGVLGAV